MNAPVDVHAYYRQITDVDIGEIARELLGGRVIQESRQTLFCDCLNHRSQSHRSLHIMLDKQGWFCFGCGVGGDVLQLVEFVNHGCVTRGQAGTMPESHRRARDFLAARVGLPPLSKLASGNPDEAEEAHGLTLRVREALTALADVYHRRLVGNTEVLSWFRTTYGIGDETIQRLKIGFADNEEPSSARELMEGPGAFTMRELTATSAFRPTSQDGVVPFFDARIVFPYWSRGHVVFMIGRRTPWTPDQEWEKSKYKKLAVRNDRNNSHVAPCIRNDVLYNEDVLLTRQERIVITEGVTDCISLIEHGFPAMSPVTVRIREADWERLLPKLVGVKTVLICQDNEVSEAGMQGALKTAFVLGKHGILTKVAALPLAEKQERARRELRERFGIDASANGKDLPDDAQALLADAKIDVNEFFAAGRTAADFERLLAEAQTPLELAIGKLSRATPDEDLSRILDPVLVEVHNLDPVEQGRLLRLIQSRSGKSRLPMETLRRQMRAAARRQKPQIGQKAAPVPRFSVPGADGGAPELPGIQVNNRQLREIVTDAWNAIHRANLPGGGICQQAPFVFQRSGRLVRLVTGESGAEIDEMNEAAVFGLLARAANWFKALEKSIVQTPPVRDAARDMLAYPDASLPILEGVISTPVFGRRGDLITEDGYHVEDRLWMACDGGLDWGEVPMMPAAEEIAAARELFFEDLLVNFPFVDASDRAHAVAAMILPFIRRLIVGPTPMHLIEAPTMGSGKGLLANLISILATGAACESRTLPESEDEIRKMLTAELMRGRPAILLDNANDRKQLHSSSLASVLTSIRWTDRKLGESSMASLPNNALWLMTANNPNLHLELTRRCVRVRIDPRVDRPWKRSGFKHPDLADWAKENRAALVRAMLTLIRAWLAAGRPPHPIRLGSFEMWSVTIGGILDVAGIPGFLASLDQLYEAADIEGQMWREFTGAWWEAFRDQPKKVGELNDFCEAQELMLRVRGDGSAKSQQTRLGSALSSQRDRVFDGRRIVKMTPATAHKGTTQYRIETEPDEGVNTWGPWGPCGDLTPEGPQTLMPFAPIASEEVGDLGDLLTTTYAREEEDVRAEGARENETHIKGNGREVPNVPKVPTVPVTEGSHGASSLGTFRDEVPNSGSKVPKLDLADLPGSPSR